jgi:uncharacterized protein (TIGR00290 family)
MARGSGPLPRALLSWSSGKDSAYALSELRRSGTCEVVGLLTTVSEAFRRVSMHGVREELLDRQAEAVGLPLRKVRIPHPCPNATYEKAMEEALREARSDGVTQVAFGDLFLEDIRAYRESRLGPAGFQAVFPLWQRETVGLAEEMLSAGVRARICCLDPKKIPREFAGRELTRELLRELPAGVDPCGERGEFHTFVTDAPVFLRPVPVTVGETVERDGFVFTDLQPV